MNFGVLESMIVCGVDEPTKYAHPCGFNDLIALAVAVINNLVVISVILATIAFLWIGFTLVTSGGDTGAREKAKNAAVSVLKGFIFVLAAWLIVYTITNVLLKPNEGYSLLGAPR